MLVSWEKEKAIFLFVFWIPECHWPEPISYFLDHGAPLNIIILLMVMGLLMHSYDCGIEMCWQVLRLWTARCYNNQVAAPFTIGRSMYLLVGISACLYGIAKWCMFGSTCGLQSRHLACKCVPVNALNFFFVVLRCWLLRIKKELVPQVAACWVQLNRARYNVNFPIDTVHLNSIFKYAS